MISRSLTFLFAWCFALSALHAMTIPGANGSDGALTVTADNCVDGVYLIDLSRAATNSWDAQPTVAGCGVYDPDKWAVVFKYSSVQIDSGCTVRFLNHPANPPVYWLVAGNVSIEGELNLDGDRGQDLKDIGVAVCAKPGPGGFAGGLSSIRLVGQVHNGGGGYGPGGAVSAKHNQYTFQGSGASHATMGKALDTDYGGQSGSLYGDETLIPLVGGSGGAGAMSKTYDSNFDETGGGAGGAGGGAICIAAQGAVSLNGTISARGNRGGLYQYNNNIYFQGGCGSGGSVRILAEKICGTGSIDACSFSGNKESLIQDGYEFTRDPDFDNLAIGGAGRVRLESNDITLCGQVFSHWNVQPTLGNGDQVILWADAKITLLTLGGVSLPSDPVYRQSGLNESVSFATAGERELVFRTENIPVDANVVVKITPRQSTADYTGTTVVATVDEGGTYASAIWRAMIPLDDARTTFQVLVSTMHLNE